MTLFARGNDTKLRTELDAARREAETELVAWFTAEHLGERRPVRDRSYAARAARIAALDA